MNIQPSKSCFRRRIKSAPVFFISVFLFVGAMWIVDHYCFGQSPRKEQNVSLSEMYMLRDKLAARSEKLGHLACIVSEGREHFLLHKKGIDESIEAINKLIKTKENRK